ncbi:MAG: hypothetical protein ACI4RD_05875 [Kiritimatiellia bacterium]
MKIFRVAWKTVKWSFIVFCVYAVSLCFREERLPGAVVGAVARRLLPANLLLHVDSLSFGFRHGVRVRGLRLYDLERKDALRPVVSAASIAFNPLLRRLQVEELCYPRLPDGYYEEGNQDRNERLEVTFPDWGAFDVTLIRPNVLAVRPELLTCVAEVTPRRISFSRIRLDWPDRERKIGLSGSCLLDIDRQEVCGEVSGQATQAHIRPLLVAIDIPVALPYMDAFTEVPEPCPARCEWKVDLVRNDLDLLLDLHPTLGKYATVPMKRADGQIRIRNCTRDNSLNYVTTVGPIAALDAEGRRLEGTVVVVGTNGYNTVDVTAASAQPLADVLKIGGFAGEYVDDDVIGDSTCAMQFRFPRAMTNNYEVLNGSGRIAVKGGHLMRMRGFKGLVDAMPSIAPAVTWFSDSTQASCDYVITNGVLKTDNLYIEGTCFSIRMAGQFDAVRETIDFTAQVLFAQKDSVIGRVLHPLTWPFSKLLLEFRLTGSPESPRWNYVSVIDRVLETVK